MEMDEAIAETVVREVREETGLDVEPVRLTGLYTDPALQNMRYPNGDQVHVVNATFACRVVGGQLCPDGEEAVEVAYFSSDALPPLSAAYEQRIVDALDDQREAHVR
jgi:ADP-ribose pyrophosphatase YjhB (NUDIX family)